ncbi:hypothetical protein D3C75_1129730 [compost metagenome]
MFGVEHDFAVDTVKRQRLVRLQCHRIALRLDLHRPPGGKQLEPKFLREQADCFAGGHAKALEYADINGLPCRRGKGFSR